MNTDMFDRRKSLWDMKIREYSVGNVLYIFIEEPKRGANCMVYPAIKREEFCGRIFERRILLKEFYPLLSVEGNAGIFRNVNGSICVWDVVRNSEEYQYARNRFLDRYALMLEMGKKDTGVVHSATPLSIFEYGDTFYMEEAYDSGVSLTDLLRKENSIVTEDLFYDPEEWNFEDFLEILKKCALALERLHDLGYYHLDIKPDNLSYTRSGTIILFDTDTFVKKEELKYQPILSESAGFSAPEIYMAMRMPEDTAGLIGPWTDMYSFTQLICWYLFGKPLNYDELEIELENSLEEKILKTFNWRNQNISHKGIYMLREFILDNLSPHYKFRRQTMTQLYWDLEKIQEYLFKFMEGQPLDNFSESQEFFTGYELKYRELSYLLFEKYAWDKTVVYIQFHDKEKCENFVRSAVTLNREHFSDIVEIRCEDYTKLKSSISICGETLKDLSEIRNSMEDPVLFLIWEERKKESMTSEEKSELMKLMNLKGCHILIVGEHDFTMSETGESIKYMNFPGNYEK